MPYELDTIGEALEAAVQFRNERGWKKHHTAGELAKALSIEASELQEELLWMDKSQIARYLETPEGTERAREEIADVLIYALLLCERVGVDPLEAIADKLEKNEEGFPRGEVQGEAKSD